VRLVHLDVHALGLLVVGAKPGCSPCRTRGPRRRDVQQLVCADATPLAASARVAKRVLSFKEVMVSACKNERVVLFMDTAIVKTV
jgi:hypothetical protein